MKTNDVNKKTNRLGSVKVYFQRLMILMVTIMASTALAGCDIVNEGDDPDNNGNGNDIDKALIGSWCYEGGKYSLELARWEYSYRYFFYADGSFKYFYFWDFNSGKGSNTEGRYTTSNGKIYMTDLLYERGNPLEAKYPNRVHEYKIGKDNVGDFLIIQPIYVLSPETYFDIKDWMGVKYRK